MLSQYSEDDLRTKIVAMWLRGHGFSAKDIHIEYTFSIRLGRSIFLVEKGELTKSSSSASAKKKPEPQTFYPRADILVRNSDSQNLFIIEVKAPDEPLDDDARDQGISYARLLQEGNIAPFVVLTNGGETKIFDSLTKEQIDGDTIPVDHPHVRAGFKVSGNDLLLRSEALDSLISLSSENLIAYCTAQTSFRMSRLRSDDLNSGKKYIPSLYIERKDAKERLLDLLDNETRRVVVVKGSPQVGKTNFICHVIEERLAQGKPSLFYPAIGVRHSLLQEISEDFEWVLGETPLSPQLVFSKLRNVLRRSNTKLTLFIDGWNEANVKLANDIDSDCERLKCDEIQIVISLTNVAASRLLGGYGGNPSFIAEEASINRDAADLIQINANIELPVWSSVTIRKYSHTEVAEAYSKYAGAYNVIVTKEHRRVMEPYVLGVAMKLYQRDTLPAVLDEPDLLKRIIEDKAARALDLRRYNIRACLTTLAKEMLFNGAPLALESAAKLLDIPIVEKLPAGFFETALLAEVSNEHEQPSIDFYYGRERDFIIAYWVQNWLSKLQLSTDITEEFSLIAHSKLGPDALRWFFSQPRHIELIQSKDGVLPDYDDPVITRILLESLYEICNRQGQRQDKWIEYALRLVKESRDSLVRIEAGRLVSVLDYTGDYLAKALSDTSSLEEFVVGLLSTSEDYSLEEATIGGEVLEAMAKLHRDSSIDEFESSDITDVLENLLGHPSRTIRESAASCLGYVAPRIFLQTVADEVIKRTLTPHSSRLEEYASGIEHAYSQLSEGFYGSICPGAFDYLKDEPESCRAEYEEWQPILEPIIGIYSSRKTVQGLIELLDDLHKYSKFDDDEMVDEGSSKPSLDVHTLPLPFDDAN